MVRARRPGLGPNLWPSPPPLGYYQMPFLLRGCGERQPPTARGSTHTHRGANEEGKRGQDSGPKDISPFRFPTHPARPPARDASGPGTVRSMSPGWGQWQGGVWADSVVLAALTKAKPGSAAGGSADPRQELGRESWPGTLPRAVGRPLLPQVLLEHLPVPGAVPGSEDSAGNETQSGACGGGFVSTSLCVERLHQRKSAGVNLRVIPFSMSERHEIMTISSPHCLRLGLPRRQSLKPGLARCRVF